jgi:DNA-binding CsgD family transcriptional regulator
MTTTSAFHALVERIEGFVPGEDSPEAILALIAQTYGMSHAAYLGLDLPTNGIDQRSIFHATYPKVWVERYIVNNYIKKDPVVATTLKSTLPIDWSKLLLKDKKQQLFLDEARNFGIGQRGLTVPIRGKRMEKGLFSIVGDMTDADWNLYKKEFMPDIITVGFYIHNMVMKTLILHDDMENIRLSPREALCLEWASNGKTFDDIADILGLSSHTVRMYLDASRQKLKCLNITHAVARAIKMELIRAPR